MKLIKAVHVQAGSVEAFDRGALEDFPLAPGVTDEAQPEEVVLPEEEPVDLEALRAEVMAQAREEATVLIQEAYNEGLRRGEEAGRAAFDARVAGIAELLEQVAEELRATRTAFLDALEPQVVALAALAARRTLQRELATDPTLISQTIRRALARLADRQQVTVRVHPDDAAVMRDERAELLDSFPGIEAFHLVIDESLARGSCVVDSTTMQADARLDALLDDILAELQP